VAAGLVFVEGVLTVIFGVGEAINIDSDRLVMGLTTAAFFIAYGVALLVCGWGMNNIRPWSRGPVLLAQLIWLGLAWNFRGGDTMPIAIGLLVVAVIVLAGLLHPRSIDALERAGNRG
jgi:peptidoglycan/LPS O-acetylase OafA/YrhL